MPLPNSGTPPDSTDPDPAEELDDPYIHTVSTEAFAEAVEAASHQEAQPLSSTGQDNDLDNLPASEESA